MRLISLYSGTFMVTLVLDQSHSLYLLYSVIGWSQVMTLIFIRSYYLWDRSLSILLYSSVCEIVRDQDWSHSLWSVLGCKSSQWGWSQEMRQMKRIICYSSTSTFENDLSLSYHILVPLHLRLLKIKINLDQSCLLWSCSRWSVVWISTVKLKRWYVFGLLYSTIHL